MDNRRKNALEFRRSALEVELGQTHSASEQAAPPSSVIIRLLICIALYSIPVATVLRPLDEFDTWWHLRTGQWIAEHQTVPTTDLFATVLEGQSWIAYSWLFEVFLYGLYAAFGLGGVVIYRVLITLLMVAVVHRFVAKREPRFIVAAGLVAATLAAFAPLLCERPWLFSIIIGILTLDAILDLRQGTARWTIWLLPLAYVLWVNIHIQFVTGLLFLALACAGPLVDLVLRRELPEDHANTFAARDWWKLVALSLACGAATLINPYHVRIYGVVVELMTKTASFDIIGECRALGFRSPWDWAVLGLFGLAIFSLGRRPHFSAFEVLLLAASAYFSFKCRRDLWVVVLASLTVLLTGPRPVATTADRFFLTPMRAAVIGWGVGAVLIGLCWWRDASEVRLAAEVATEFPAQAAAFVEEQGYTGPLYNSADWGSYLLWRLPNHPIAIDGRYHLYGDERALRFHRTVEGRPGWENDPDLSNARVVILRAQAPLTALLRRDPRFQRVHEDPVAVVFVANP